MVFTLKPVLQPERRALRRRPGKARSLLAEAGYADGLELKIHYIPGPNEQQLYVAEYISLALAEVGVDVEVVQSADLPSWAGIFFGGPDAWHMTMNAYFNWGDPVIGVQRAYVCANIVMGVFVNNSAYCNEEVDEILYAAAAETDFDARKALYDEFQVITAVELPFYGINALPIYGPSPDLREEHSAGRGARSLAWKTSGSTSRHRLNS
ncbi:MAG: hypothetical protein Ct9H300mP12_15900 [Acidimicrobiales bacterium]|nr:MAG: hypothetical protein Ct9H300mP12_15900 [Acidimicrobiales bacterium]